MGFHSKIKQFLPVFKSLTLALFIGFTMPHAEALDQPPLKIGINPWPGYEFVYLAQEKGFFKKQGLDLKLIEFASLSDSANAYQRMQIDGLATTGIDLYFLHKRSPERTLQIVLVTDYSSGGDQIIGRSNASKSNSLKGLRIAAEPASLGIYFLKRILAKQNLSIADIKLVKMDQSTMKNSFEQNQIDAAVTYPPVSVHLAKLPGTQVLATSAEIPGEIIDCLAVRQQWVQENKNKVAIFSKGFYQAIQYAKTNSAEALGIMAKRQGITVEEFATALKGVKLADHEEWKRTFADGKILRDSMKEIRACTHLASNLR